MAVRKRNIREQWRRMRASSYFRSAVMFLIFVAVAVFFWLILALNDSVTHTFRVKLNLENVPDSVVFINDPPADMHVTVRDRGTNILRSGVVKNPRIDINFRDYSDDGIFRMTRADVTAVLKSFLGSSIQIVSTSLDSIRLYYTDTPGKRVPIEVRVQAEASSGNIIVGRPVPLERAVRIYSYGNEIDTVYKVYTKKMVVKGLDKTSVVSAVIQPIPGVEIVPDTVKLRINVEPLVHKEGFVKVEAQNVPANENLLLFPNVVPVSYYIPMSKFADGDVPITVRVDYHNTKVYSGNKLPLQIMSYPPFIVNPEIKIDSVEYTLVRRR